MFGQLLLLLRDSLLLLNHLLLLLFNDGDQPFGDLCYTVQVAEIVALCRDLLILLVKRVEFPLKLHGVFDTRPLLFTHSFNQRPPLLNNL